MIEHARIAVEQRVSPYLAPVGILTLRYGLALIFIWFGLAKFFAPGPDLELIAGLTAPFGSPAFVPFALGVWEVAIGLLYLHDRLLPYGAATTLVHQAGTFLPFVVLPGVTVASFPWLTLDGQFILKNVMLIGGAMVLWHLSIAYRDVPPRDDDTDTDTETPTDS